MLITILTSSFINVNDNRCLCINSSTNVNKYFLRRYPHIHKTNNNKCLYNFLFLFYNYYKIREVFSFFEIYEKGVLLRIKMNDVGYQII